MKRSEPLLKKIKYIELISEFFLKQLGNMALGNELLTGHHKQLVHL